MNYVYSAENNLFYPVQLQRQYEKNGDWPSDAVGVDDNIFHEFTSLRDGLVRVAGENGLPVWGGAPARTHQELTALAEQQKQTLQDEALKITAIWRAELQLGIISDTDKARLTAWIEYYKAVQEIDADSTTDIKWPTKPEN
ncbi:tail fiber assembly protein [Citrobacter sp. C348]|uniref:tail fiber assembly protein n=1 Tax=Citrobacter sp. C348 TaxID=3048143 RepID=UPI0039C30400